MPLWEKSKGRRKRERKKERKRNNAVNSGHYIRTAALLQSIRAAHAHAWTNIFKIYLLNFSKVSENPIFILKLLIGRKLSLITIFKI